MVGLIDGMVAATVIDDLPASVSYTGLARHALFTVLLGWWWVPRVLAAIWAGGRGPNHSITCKKFQCLKFLAIRVRAVSRCTGHHSQ